LNPTKNTFTFYEYFIGNQSAGHDLGPVRHICAFFHNKEEECRTLKDFIQDGVDRGEKGFHIVDANHREAHNVVCAIKALMSMARKKMAHSRSLAGRMHISKTVISIRTDSSPSSKIF
jgi:hypothetical protein